MMAARGSNGRFRCDECGRIAIIGDTSHTDAGPGGSNFFCYRCGEGLEDRAAIIEARILRRNPRARVPETALFFMAYGDAT